MRELLDRLAGREDLTEADMTRAMNAIMDGAVSPTWIGGFLMALRVKGECVTEITAAARVMRERATGVPVDDLPHLIDTCGTGGDGLSTFNVSTASALVAAAAGGHVAKHGNRSVSSSSGSADVLEAAGVAVDQTPAAVAGHIRKLGVGFMFAPAHHGATRHAVPVRKDLGVRTLFNLLGPLTNPAAVPAQVMGVYALEWIRPLAEVLQRLGSSHVMVVHSDDGMDEISPAAPTQVAELKDGKVSTWTIDPAQFDIHVDLSVIAATDPSSSLALMRQGLTSASGAAADTVALNAGAAIYVAGLVETYAQGVARARELQAAGAGWERLQALASASQRDRNSG